jgi:hypothetical protein
MGFDRERVFFAQYRDGLSGNLAVSSATVKAIAEVLTRYNTVVWENRFIVGGVVEQILGASARALGLDVLNAGKQNQGYDLELPGDVPAGISVKGVFASTGGKHNLVNLRSADRHLSRDECLQRWSRATLFVMTGVGIGYSDRSMNGDCVSPSADAVQISGKCLKEWWSENPEWLINLPIPPKPAGPAIRVASDAVGRDILEGFPVLLPHWKAEI